MGTLRRILGRTGKAGLNRFRDFLPISSPLPYLGEGDTPLTQGRRVGEALGLKRLYLKNEGCNPTGSTKDRAASLSVAEAIEEGRPGLLNFSTGNAAAAIAAYSAAAGLKCLVICNKGASSAKVNQMLLYGARCIEIEDLFDHPPESMARLVVDLARVIDLKPAFFWKPISPTLYQSYKTISFEVVEQLGRAPDVVVVPTGGGDGLYGQWIGYKQLHQEGIIDTLPRMIAAQAAGAAPLVKAFDSGNSKVEPIEKAQTVASGVQVTYSGEHALEALRESQGTAVAIDDPSILYHQRLLARLEGLWVEPTAALALAAVPLLKERQLVREEDLTVSVFTGAGFKQPMFSSTPGSVVKAQFDVQSIQEAAHVLMSET